MDRVKANKRKGRTWTAEQIPAKYTIIEPIYDTSRLEGIGGGSLKIKIKKGGMTDGCCRRTI